MALVEASYVLRVPLLQVLLSCCRHISLRGGLVCDASLTFVDMLVVFREGYAPGFIYLAQYIMWIS